MTAVRLRQGCRYALLLAALLGAPSCQWAGDTGAAKASFAVIRQQIDDVSARITSAVQNGEADRIPALDRDMNAALDAARNQSSAMNLLDREHLNINGMGSMKARHFGQLLGHPGRLGLELQEVVHDRRGVDDDHIESRISRRISDGGRFERGLGRLLIRAVSSSIVSVSASRSAIRSR